LLGGMIMDEYGEIVEKGWRFVEMDMGTGVDAG
jgi:hypothetical protein